MDNGQLAALYVGAVATGLAIGAAYDRAKKAFNKRFPDYEPIVEYDQRLGLLGIGALFASVFGCDKNLSPLGLVIGNALIFHYELINSFEVARTLIFCRNKKPAEPTEIKPTKKESAPSAPGMKWHSAHNIVSRWGDKIPAVIDFTFK